MALCLTACPKGRPGEGKPGRISRKQPAPPVLETPAELSHRLRPRLEQGGGGLELSPKEAGPLLTLSPGLGLSLRLVLRRPGGDQVPSEKDLEAIRGLGLGLGKILHRNLLALMHGDPRPAFTAAASEKKGIRALQLQVDRPGLEALVLLPEFWDLIEKTMGKEAVLALPSRSSVQFLPRQGKVMESSAPLQLRWFAEGGSPLCDRYILRKDGQLLPGPEFRILSGK